MASEIRADGRVELHEKTDIRDFKTNQKIDIVVIDVSFISLTKIMPSVLNLSSGYTQIIAMAKPQFEGQPSDLNSGVVKNSAIRRQILKNLENWFVNNGCVIKLKKDSSLAGKKLTL
jgi:23S rRNA (cytidine1920-2'-O)/16S rRNA (cytidine1409-2'-O)-methyltransferase